MIRNEIKSSQNLTSYPSTCDNIKENVTEDLMDIKTLLTLLIGLTAISGIIYAYLSSGKIQKIHAKLKKYNFSN